MIAGISHVATGKQCKVGAGFELQCPNKELRAAAGLSAGWPWGQRLCPRIWPGDSGYRMSIGTCGGWHGGGGCRQSAPLLSAPHLPQQFCVAFRGTSAASLHFGATEEQR